MRGRRAGASAIAIAIGVAACAETVHYPNPPVGWAAPWRTGAEGRGGTPPDAPFTTPPGAIERVRVAPPMIRDARLPSGLRVVVLERHELPMVAMRAFVDRGAVDAPPGVAELATRMLFGGTARESGRALRTTLREAGATWNADVWEDGAAIDLKVPSPSAPLVFARLADALRGATFADEEVERVRREELAGRSRARATAGRRIDEVLRALLFEDASPYARPIEGDTDALARIARQSLVAFRDTWVTPAETTLFFVGDVVTSDVLAAVERELGDWKRGATAPRPAAATVRAGAAKERRVVLVDAPEEEAATFEMACVGPARGGADAAAMPLVAAALEAAITRAVRLDHDVYGVTVRASAWRDTGRFAIGGVVERRRVGEILATIFGEMDRLRDDGTMSALTLARRDAPPRLWSSLATASGALASLTAMVERGERVETFFGRLDADPVDLSDAARAARTYVRPAAMSIVVAGDAARILPTLDGLHLGRIEVRRAADDRGL